MAEDERQDPPEGEENNLAASGAAGEPADVEGAAPPEGAPPEEPGSEGAEEPTAAEGASPEEPPAEEEQRSEGAEEQPAAEAPAAEEQPAAEAPAAEEQPAAEQPAAEEVPAEPAAGTEPAEAPAEEQPPTVEDEVPAERASRPERQSRGGDTGAQPDVVPGAHLEPDLVLESDRAAEDDEFARYADSDAEAAPGEAAATVEEQPQPVTRTPIDLAADARYHATGKRKTAVARVVVKPGGGTYQVNGRTLEEFFPRPTLQQTARQPLEAAGYETRMDVIARIHGGGVSAQAGALRHGIARALVEADPNLRTELKRRGYLTRDAREKERKKAGLKKARKRPQFSKR
jgi:small subunit ribosomal protein S9